MWRGLIAPELHLVVTQFERELRVACRPKSVTELHAVGVTEAILSGPHWRRTSRGWYVPVSVQLTPAQRILDASPLVPPTGALTGWAAAYAHGVDGLDGLDPQTMQPWSVTICLGRDLGRRDLDGVRYLRERLSAAEVVTTAGLRMTAPVRACFDTARDQLTLAEAVVVVDLAAAALGLDLATMAAWCSGLTGVRGVGLVREALRWADLGSASRWESRLRMFYRQIAGLPGPLVNQPVFDLEGAFLGVPDLFDPNAGLVTEFDGQDHRERRQHREDNLREERLEEANLVVCRVDSLDLRRPKALADRLIARYRQGLARDPGRDRWTLRQPAWWPRRRAARVDSGG